MCLCSNYIVVCEGVHIIKVDPFQTAVLVREVLRQNTFENDAVLIRITGFEQVAIIHVLQLTNQFQLPLENAAQTLSPARHSLVRYNSHSEKAAPYLVTAENKGELAG